MSSQQKKYPEIEYKTIMGPDGMSQTEDFLNELGKDGWECCHITKPYNSNPRNLADLTNTNARTYILRRKKAE